MAKTYARTQKTQKPRRQLVTPPPAKTNMATMSARSGRKVGGFEDSDSDDNDLFK